MFASSSGREAPPHLLHSLPPPSPRKPFTLTQSLNRHRFTSNYRYAPSVDDVNMDAAAAYGAPGYDAPSMAAGAPSSARGVQHSNTMPRSFGYAGGGQSPVTSLQYGGTLPRDQHEPGHAASLASASEPNRYVTSSQRQQLAQQQQQQQPIRKQRGFMASFGKGFFKLRSGKWSSSAPNLGDSVRRPPLHVTLFHSLLPACVPLAIITTLTYLTMIGSVR